MKSTLIGVFGNQQTAQEALRELQALGIDANDVYVVTDESEFRSLTHIPSSDLDFYLNAMREGSTLVVVNADESMLDRVTQILVQRNTIDVDARGAEYRAQGQNYQLRDYNDQDVVLPVIEEDLKVGKRQVERGRMRVYTRVTEQPVEEQVHLREETVHVERRPVDRPATDADIDAFKEGEFEVTTMAEEAVVSKSARVVEEVVINKDVQEHTETVQDTVRRTDVEVEEAATDTARTATSAARTTGVRDFADYDTDFRTYYQSNLASSGRDYSYYEPSFRYAYDLGTNERYRDMDWNTLEPEARRRWEETNPNTWEQIKDSVRHGWERVTGQR